MFDSTHICSRKLHAYRVLSDWAWDVPGIPATTTHLMDEDETNF